MTLHSSILAWKIPRAAKIWTRLSVWAHTHTHTHTHTRKRLEVVSILGAIAGLGGLPLLLSQSHSGARGREKQNKNLPKGTSFGTNQRNTPSVFARSKLILRNYKDNGLPQILVLSEERRFLYLQEFRTTNQALYKFVAEITWAPKHLKLRAEFPGILRVGEDSIHLGETKAIPLLGNPPSTLMAENSHRYNLRIMNSRWKLKKPNKTKKLQQHRNVRHHELRASKDNRESELQKL